MDSVVFVTVIQAVLDRVGLDEGERIVWLRAVVYAGDVEAGAVVAHASAAASAIQVQKFRL